MKTTIGATSTPNITSVIGISMGDEGKGRVVHEILEEIHQQSGHPAKCVMKVNGGANAGHTAAGLKLNLLPSGVGNPDVQNLVIGSGVVADPRKFLWEARPLEKKGIEVLGRLAIDEKCLMTDISHRLLDLAWENYRINQLGEPNRGSTGRGITPAYNDETGQWQIFYQIFLGPKEIFSKKLKDRFERAINTIRYVCKVGEDDWFSFFDTLTEAELSANQTSIEEKIFPRSEFSFEKFMTKEPYTLNFDGIEETYWKAGQELVTCIKDVRKILLNSTDKNQKVVAEFGQAFWLDKRHGFTPNVTASHTYGSEIFFSGGIPIQEINQVGCCKAYDTKVGTHHFITQIDHIRDPWGIKLAKLEFGTSTGRQRMVGWFDAVEKGNALRYGGFDEIVINKLDALTSEISTLNKIRICTSYKDENGETTYDVPRDESKRRKLQPVYEEFDTWETNLQNIKCFDSFPKEAKIFVSRMITSIIEVAYGGNWEAKILPNIKFIGVGPDPKQIVTDIPSTMEFMSNKTSFTIE